MREISILEEQLLDEYMRCERNLISQTNELERLQKGCISKKKINGRTYYYLQWKENGKVKSKYIPIKELGQIQDQIEERRRWQMSIRNLKRSMRQIEKALGKGLINEYKQNFQLTVGIFSIKPLSTALSKISLHRKCILCIRLFERPA